eukprot:UN11774
MALLDLKTKMKENQNYVYNGIDISWLVSWRAQAVNASISIFTNDLPLQKRFLQAFHVHNHVAQKIKHI